MRKEVREQCKALVGKKVIMFSSSSSIDAAGLEGYLAYEELRDLYYLCNNKNNGKFFSERHGYLFTWLIDENVTNIVEDSMFKEGDLVTRDGGKTTRKVLAVVGPGVYILSSTATMRKCTKRPHDSFGITMTKGDLEYYGYTLYNPEPEVIEELTMEEVCKALGRTIKIKK